MTLFTYLDGIRSERCEFCGSELKGADGKPRVLVTVEDVEALMDLLVEYVDCPEVWSETITRLERAVGLTHEQIGNRDRDEWLSKETITS